jgi:iron complex outermembrane receptor protein
MNTFARAALFCATSCAAAATAQAQSTRAQQPAAASATDQSATEIGDIIVTAQKRSERLLDVPLSITAVTGDQLAKQGVVSPADLAKVVPGFTAQTSQYGAPVYQIRGIGFFDNQVAAGPTVTIYTDQAPLPYAFMAAGASLDLERVEVLKGPQGTLFGENSTGGAVNYIAAKPTKQLAAGLDATYGRFNEVDLGGFVSGPVTETLGVRVAARYERRDGWQQSITRNDTNGRRDFLVGRIIADWQPTDRLKVELNVNGWRDHSDIQTGQPRAYLPIGSATGLPQTIPRLIAVQQGFMNYPYPTGDTSNRLADWDAGLNLRVRDTFFQAAGRIDYSVSDDVHFVSISSYSHLRTLTPFDTDATNIIGTQATETGRISSFSQEARLEGNAGRLKWIVGGNYQNDKTRDFNDVPIYDVSNSEFTVAPTFGIHFRGPNQLNNQDIRDLAGFGSLEYRLTDTLTLQGSARYTDEHRRFTGCALDEGGVDPISVPLNLFLGYNATPGQCVTLLPNGTSGLYHTNLNEHNTSWRGSINWKPQPDLLLYANVTKGFKAGSFATVPAFNYLQYTPVTQESVVAYEAGFKASLADRKVDVSAAAFYYDYKDKQLQGFRFILPFGFLPTLINVPKSRVAGAEFNITARPVSGLRLTTGITYVDSKVLGSALTTSPFGANVDIKGEAFPSTPKWQAQGDVEYDFALRSGLSPFLGASVSYRSDTLAAFGGRSGPAGTHDYFAIKAYTLLDLRAGVNIGERYRVQIFGKNVTGTHYWNTVAKLTDTVVRLTGMPTTYGISFTARY